MARPVFSIQGLSFAYGPHQVIRDLDLDIAPGAFHGVVGPNGSGKTTLADLMAGMKQPAAGSVRFLGQEVGSAPRRELARKLALVPQEFAINFPFTVRQTVLMGRHPYIPRFAAPGAPDWRAVENALAAMEVAEMADKPVTELSGGEKQRVVLARALAQGAGVMLLDEPTSHLDVRHALAVLELLRGLVAEQGATVVAVLHDLNLAAAYCQNLALLKDGKVHAAGPTDEVLNAANLEEVFKVEALVSHDEFTGRRMVRFRQKGDRS